MFTVNVIIECITGIVASDVSGFNKTAIDPVKIIFCLFAFHRLRNGSSKDDKPL